MNRLQKAAIMAELVDDLRQAGSWCGETHIQKAAFFLQQLFKVPTGFEFILYKHGPFSFDLRDELTAMRADGLLDIQTRYPYGPSYVTTAQCRALRDRLARTVVSHHKQVEFVARKLGGKGVTDLERLATALFVTAEGGGANTYERASRIHELKPHVSVDDALAAVKLVDVIVEESAAVQAN